MDDEAVSVNWNGGGLNSGLLESEGREFEFEVEVLNVAVFDGGDVGDVFVFHGDVAVLEGDGVGKVFEFGGVGAFEYDEVGFESRDLVVEVGDGAGEFVADVVELSLDLLVVGGGKERAKDAKDMAN